jgi:hypothetical protein
MEKNTGSRAGAEGTGSTGTGGGLSGELLIVDCRLLIENRLLIQARG